MFGWRLSQTPDGSVLYEIQPDGPQGEWIALNGMASKMGASPNPDERNPNDLPEVEACLFHIAVIELLGRLCQGRNQEVIQQLLARQVERSSAL